jgi:hypothetical protein
MEFSLENSIEILERTPGVLGSHLNGLSDDWLKNNEGESTWSPYEIVGHLISGEKTDWLARIRIILSNSEKRGFEPFARFAHLNEDPNKPISDLIVEFRELRKQNLQTVKSLNITKHDLKRTGIHPAFGEVTLQQLISTWVAHDLGHIAQISRVMAKQYKEEVGPWIEYLRILRN